MSAKAKAYFLMVPGHTVSGKLGRPLVEPKAFLLVISY